jgi:predicted GH43/DUF377 family glycosyl hydrolase
MWYGGFDASGVSRIGLATSSNGVSWTKGGSNPILDVGSGPGAFDLVGCMAPCVISDGGTYRMWYLGVGYTTRIGYADSTDGINWTKFWGNPVVGIGSWGTWDSSALFGPSVIKDGETFKMWYGGQGPTASQIGYATNP